MEDPRMDVPGRPSGPYPADCVTCEEPYLCRCRARVVFKMCQTCVEYTNMHDEKICTCNICGEVFRTFTGLKNHVPLHSVGKIFSCRNCGKYYLERDRKATDDGIECRNCKYGDALELYYFELYPASDGEDFKCGPCNVIWPKNLLAPHLCYHLTKDVYGCKICGKADSEFSSFREHIKDHFKDHRESATERFEEEGGQ